MSKAYPASKFAQELAEVLGIGDKPVLEITLRAKVGEAVVVDVSLLVQEDQADGLIEVIKRHEIKLKPDAPT